MNTPARAQCQIINKSRVVLIPFAMEHVRLTFSWLQDEELRRMFLMRGELTREGHWAHFERVLADISQRVYAIILDGLHVGNCGFKNLSPAGKEGELWIYIGEPAMRRKKIGTRATRLMLKEGLGELGLKVIRVHVADFNIAARKMYEQIGFLEAAPQVDERGEWTNRGCRVLRMKFIGE